MKFDLHVHTKSSYDSFSCIEKILKKAKGCGLDGVAITDHDKFNKFDLDYLEGLYGVWIIPGVEISTEIGDIIGLFVSQNITLHDAEKVIDEIHRLDGVAILAHPFKRIKDYPEELLLKLDAVEVINSRWVDLRKNKELEKVDNVLSSVQGVTAGSDSHFVFEIGNAYLETRYLRNKSELRKVISEGSGTPVCVRMAIWNDIASQGVKFIKNPSFKQALRLVYYFLKLLFKNRKGLIVE